MNYPPESLSALQNWMQQALLDPVTGKNIKEIEQYVAPSNQLTASQSLAIYQRSYYNRLLECLREQFKALHHTLGNELFSEFAVLYLKKYPSKTASLSELGEGFPGFLEETRPDRQLREPWVDFMIAMAAFECDLYRLFDLQGSEGERFADVATPDGDLQLQDCFELKQYPFDVNHYYQEVAAGGNPVMQPEQQIDIAFVRTDFQVYVIMLNRLQYKLLELLKNGIPVPYAKKELIRNHKLTREQMEWNWQDWKKEWVKKGFFLIKPHSVPGRENGNT